MNKRNVLVVSKNLLDMSDAQSQQSFALINALTDAGWFLDVVTAESRNGAAEVIKAPRQTRVFALPASWHSVGKLIHQKIHRKLYRSLFSVIQSKWSANASRKISELCEEKKYSAIISIALPMESHLAVLNAKYRPALWIACMSDPWPESILPKPYADFAIPLLSHFQKILVSKISKSANHLVFTCSEQLDFMKRHYQSVIESKSSIIPHIAPGILEASNKRADQFIISHCGSLSRERVCPSLATALSKLPEHSTIVINFIGDVNDEMRYEFEKSGASNRVRYTGTLPKEDAMMKASEGNALLLIEAEMEEYPFLPSKLADYSSTLLPIVAITGNQSPTAKLISEYNCGMVCGHDTDSILNALTDIEKKIFQSSPGLNCHFSPGSVANKYNKIILSKPT